MTPPRRPRPAAAAIALAALAAAQGALAQEPPAGGPPSAALSADVALSPGRTFAQARGDALYAQVCAACHQADGRGAAGAAAYPALAGDGRLAQAGYPVAVVLDGLRGMPPLGRMMSDAQVAEVVNYVRTHFGNRYDDPVSAADVRAARR